MDSKPILPVENLRFDLLTGAVHAGDASLMWAYGRAYLAVVVKHGKRYYVYPLALILRSDERNDLTFHDELDGDNSTDDDDVDVDEVEIAKLFAQCAESYNTCLVRADNGRAYICLSEDDPDDDEAEWIWPVALLLNDDEIRQLGAEPPITKTPPEIIYQNTPGKESNERV